MTTERRCFLAHARDLTGDGPHHVTAEGHDLVLLRVDGQLRAFDGQCPHQGALLGEGELEGGALVCRNHRWRFDARTGARIGGPQCLRAHAVHEVDGRVEVVLASAEAAQGETGVRTRDDLPGPRPWPVVGNALQLEPRRLHVTLEGWARRYGPLYRVRLGARPFVVVTEPVHEDLYAAGESVEIQAEVGGDLTVAGQTVTDDLAARAAETAVTGARALSKNAYKIPMTKGVVRRTILRVAQA